MQYRHSAAPPPYAQTQPRLSLPESVRETNTNHYDSEKDEPKAALGSAPQSLLSHERLLDAPRDQVLDVSLAGDQLIHNLFRDPGPNWSVEGVSYNGETDQIEALLPTILCLCVVFDPDHILGLQAILLAHRRREMLGVIGNRSAAILWHLRGNETYFPSLRWWTSISQDASQPQNSL